MSDTTRTDIDRAIGGVLFNVRNFPEGAQSHLLGQNMAPLRQKLTSAVFAALARPSAVVSTREQLQALPLQSVVLTAAGTIACRFDDELFTIFGDERPKARWGDLALPARVLFDPTEVVR